MKYSKRAGELSQYKDIRIDDKDSVIKIVNKLCRHFKIPKLETVFRKHSPDTGTCFTSAGIVSFHPRRISVYVICHEVAHWMDARKNSPGKWHTKKHLTYTKRLVNYCRKKNYWGLVQKMKDTVNILDYDEYRADGGELCYEAYIRCLMDSGNLTKSVGEMQIKIHQEQDRFMAKDGWKWNGEYWVKS